ncbi:hypothetical protein TVAG_374690 [Trichomonas vaginalis G3]|uniref:Uncharacterized protein n=1 Tax=Trichomonas vaginalis (strain ATCC PRA-98 / G3) TaxID=412133 RepID=A2FCI2_TRIV3|nr:OST3 / OST6 family, transporter family [Trichomonas vaginalis G3]EAX97388.1 hypothetical protein TVAG_374690 [Trichomonas vaginalis G3]KAI5547298.1 OST3 / OST6 family, transporter family [Trichomonas vaginalis G3]|eukprot:XP_001310318.1 hypothetical protein [Trichomonas vaginalis G3]
MGKSFKDIILAPFAEDRFFVPELEIPISTIKIPSMTICMLIVFSSFMVISAGTIFCWVHNSPFIGGQYDQNGKIRTLVFSEGMSWQFGAEGFLASMVYVMTAFSFLASYYVFKHQNDNPNDPTIIAAKVFGYTSPVWIILMIMTFRSKLRQYFPTPFPQ